MSNQTNDALLDRAAGLIEETASHPSGCDKQLLQAVETEDLDEVYRLVIVLEALLAQEHFHNYNVRVW